MSTVKTLSKEELEQALNSLLQQAQTVSEQRLMLAGAIQIVQGQLASLNTSDSEFVVDAVPVETK